MSVLGGRSERKESENKKWGGFRTITKNTRHKNQRKSFCAFVAEDFRRKRRRTQSIHARMRSALNSSVLWHSLFSISHRRMGGAPLQREWPIAPRSFESLRSWRRRDAR